MTLLAVLALGSQNGTKNRLKDNEGEAHASRWQLPTRSDGELRGNDENVGVLMTRLLVSIAALLLSACASSVDAPGKPRSAAGTAGAAAIGYHGPVHRMPADYVN